MKINDKTLRNFNLSISFFMIFLISSSSLFYVIETMSENLKFELPYKSLLLKDNKFSNKEFDLKNIENWDSKTWQEFRNKQSFNKYNLYSIYSAKKIFKQFLDITSEYDLDLFLKQNVNSLVLKDFLKKNKDFFEILFKFKAEIISFDKNYGKVIFYNIPTLKEKGFKIITNSQYRALVYFSKLPSLLEETPYSNEDFFLDFTISFNKENKITNISYIKNKEMVKIIKDITLFKYINRENIKNLFSIASRDKILVQKILLNKITQFKKIGVEYKNGQAEGVIEINNKKYNIIISNEKIKDILLIGDKK